MRILLISCILAVILIDLVSTAAIAFVYKKDRHGSLNVFEIGAVPNQDLRTLGSNVEEHGVFGDFDIDDGEGVSIQKYREVKDLVVTQYDTDEEYPKKNNEEIKPVVEEENENDIKSEVKPVTEDQDEHNENEYNVSSLTNQEPDVSDDTALKLTENDTEKETKNKNRSKDEKESNYKDENKHEDAFTTQFDINPQNKESENNFKINDKSKGEELFNGFKDHWDKNNKFENENYNDGYFRRTLKENPFDGLYDYGPSGGRYANLGYGLGNYGNKGVYNNYFDDDYVPYKMKYGEEFEDKKYLDKNRINRRNFYGYGYNMF